MVAGCALGTDACHWMFKKNVNMHGSRSTRWLQLIAVGKLVETLVTRSTLLGYDNVSK